MKIAFLLGNVNFGGGERILQTLMHQLSLEGHKIMIYSWNKKWLKQNENVPYNIFVLDHAPIGIYGKLMAFNDLRKILKRDQPSCLIIFSLALAEVAVFSAKFAKIPTILSERVDPSVLPKSRFHRVMKKIAFSISDKVVFQTHDVKRYFSKRIQNKGVVIQNMIMNENYPVKINREKEIIAAGRLDKEKNFQMLIKVFATIKLQGYKLRILGEGPYRGKLEDLVDTLNMNHEICFEGHVEDVMHYFNKGDIFVITSNHEGMPNVLIEAMAGGLACISTDFKSGGARALIKNGQNGIIIPLNDCKALENALLLLVDNCKLKDQIIKNSLNIRFTNSKREIIPQWIHVIESFSENKK